MTPTVILASSTVTIPSNALSVSPLDGNIELTANIAVRRSANPDGLTLKDYADRVIAGSHPPLDRNTFNDHFSSLDEEIELVIAFAQEHNLTIVDSHAPGAYVKVSGIAHDFNRAFGITLQSVTDSERKYVSYNGSINIPLALESIIEHVTGLDQSIKFNRFYTTPGRHISPSYPYPQAITPLQAAQAYNIPPNSGAGQVIGIVELGGGYTQSNLDRSFGLINTVAPTIIPILTDRTASNNPAGGEGTYNIEVVGDIYVAGAAAPQATIAVYFADNNLVDSITSATLSTATITPNVISISYGAPEDQIGNYPQFLEPLFQAAATLGITVIASSGDSGVYGPGGTNQYVVTYPASSPYVLSVGGTALQLTSGGAIGFETAWNGVTGIGGASGGGMSKLFGVPTWQTGLTYTLNTPSGTAIPLTGRGVPDVSANADPNTGYSYYVQSTSSNNTLVTVGGTSLAAPMWAGAIASLNSLFKTPLGFVNPLLYQDLGILNDVTVGNNNIQFNNDGVYTGGYEATAGWDAVTGLGTPNVIAMYNYFDGSTLANLSISTGTLSPSFLPGTTFYRASVDYATTSMAVTPLALEPGQTISINGVVTSSNIATVVDLNVGVNDINVSVESLSQFNTTTYTVEVTRAQYVSNTSTLASLLLSIGTLVPPFSSTITSYYATVSNAISAITVTPTTTDHFAYILYLNGVNLGFDVTIGPIILNVGDNPLYFTVVAQDTITTTTYYVDVIREPAENTGGGGGGGHGPTAKIAWITTATNLGTANPSIGYTVTATGTDTVYSVISGSLPNGISLNPSSGNIGGNAESFVYPYTSTFVVRAFSAGINSVADKTFTISVPADVPPTWKYFNNFLVPGSTCTIQGPNSYGLFIDKDFMSYQMTAYPQYGTVYTVTYSVVSGFDTLPNGLTLNSDGLLSGIVNTDTILNQIDTFTFDVAASDGYQSTTQTFAINVINANSSANTYTTLGTPIYQLQAPEFIGDLNLGLYRDNSIQYIPVTAYDPYPWMGPVTYNTGTILPFGMSLDPNSGIISGYIPTQTNYLSSYDMVITASKTSSPPAFLLVGSPTSTYPYNPPTTVTSVATFTMSVIRSDEDIITWVTQPNLGSIDIGVPSTLSLLATHTEYQYALSYSEVAPSLPPGLVLQPSGNITGTPTASGIYTATMVASTNSSIYSISNWNAIVSQGQYNSAVSLPQQFTINVKSFPTEYTNIYLKPFLSPAQRTAYHNFITSASIFVPELIYRPDDSNFGVQTDFRCYVEYGIRSLNSATDYAGIIQDVAPGELYFGPVSTITAVDSTNTPIYDMVYVQILDSTTGILNKIQSNVNSQNFPISLEFSPAWQTTSINSGNGFIYGVVLCYTLPNQGQKVVSRFNRLAEGGGFTFSQLNFTVDRLIFDYTQSNPASSYLLF